MLAGLLRKIKSNPKGNALIISIFLLLITFSIYFFMQYEPIQRTYLYPYPYQSIVEKYSQKYKVDSSLVASVIMKESKFNIFANSHRGALGLMQLMPTTAKWIAEEIDEKEFSIEKLKDPETNIKMGVWYLNSLQNEFKYNEILTLAAYNAGRGTVHDWMDEYGWDYNFSEIESIPYEETKLYVRAVIKGKAKYRNLYNK